MGMKVTMKDPKKSDHFFEEAIKTLRTNIQFSGKTVKAILLTSCYPNEGKSNVTFALAEEMGKAGKRVLLIDADIRKSTFVRRYRVKENVFGLSQLLSGQISLADTICQTNFQNLDVIFAGPSAPNPSELLSDAEFGKLIERCKEFYDYIFIDTPPSANLADATVVAAHCDASILVIESGAVSYKIAQKVKAQLERSGCRILGAVLNKVDVKAGRYYKAYDKYYQK